MDAAFERRRKRRGRAAETATVAVLRLRGLRVLARNVRVRGAVEVDIVARSGSTLVLVEVKARAADSGLEAVDARRRHGLRRAGEQLLADPAYAWARTLRFDVVAWHGLRPAHLTAAF